MKKGIVVSVISGVVGLILVYIILTIPSGRNPFCEQKEELNFKLSGKEFLVNEEGTWEPFKMTGVNMGTGYPGLFPNESGIEQDTYYRWFEQISEMNANTVRVYKIQSPEFYTAFYKYNKEHDKKLYLVQGVDFAEQYMYSEKNLLDDEVKEKLFEETYEVVDAIHGDSITINKKENSLECYLYDVSDYVLGYILGIEWDEVFVDYVCRKNVSAELYEGKYLSSERNATAFESFLAEWGDKTIEYEEELYKTQRLISFCNWPDTDPFVNELHINQVEGYMQAPIEVFVDLEHIKTTDQLKSGMFVSYNVYPYFPSFLQYGQYTEYVDDEGKNNPYLKYLMDLAEYHTYPVIITEYGIPASRSVAYYDIWKGYSHGGLSETEQGQAVADLYHEIEKSGCAGSIAFTWQDEWYKTAWNEKLLSDPDKRAFWSNAMCAEQFFGLLAFEPGTEEDISYQDGDLSEWNEDDEIFSGDQLKLSMRSDEKYVYFLVKGLDTVSENNAVTIALDVSEKNGKDNAGTRKFGRNVDFLIEINNTGDSVIRVDKDYDMLSYSALGGYHDVTEDSKSILLNKYLYPETSYDASGNFVVVSRAAGDIYGRLEDSWMINEVGVLKMGNTNPDSTSYCSDADYNIQGDCAEIRIPWQMLNFKDPSECMLQGDEKAKYIYAAPFYEDEMNVTEFGQYRLKKWNRPQWHERLKKSYYIIQEAFGSVE